MKNMYRSIVFLGFLVGTFGCPLLADPSTAYYLKEIKHIEKILDDDGPYDVEFLKSKLSSLRSKVTSPNRLERIDAAYRRMRDQDNVQVPLRRPSVSQEQMPIVPTPTPRPSNTNGEQMPIVPNPVPNPSLEQGAEEIEALLLHVESMITTAQTAIVLTQKDKAHDALQQARMRLQEISDALSQSSFLRERFDMQAQMLAGNVEQTQKQIDELP